MDLIYHARDQNFGNARDVRNIFESVIGNQANRIVALPTVNDLILSTVELADVVPVQKAVQLDQGAGVIDDKSGRSNLHEST